MFYDKLEARQLMGFDFLNYEIKDDVLCVVVYIHSSVKPWCGMVGLKGVSQGYYTKLLLNLDFFHIYLT